MKLWEIQLALDSPFHTPWQADILFGHLAWTYRELFGETKLLQWLEAFKAGQPPYVISDGYLFESFPRPMYAPMQQNMHNQTKAQRIEQIKVGKKHKKIRYMQQEDFINFLRGKGVAFQHKVQGTFEKHRTTHNVIDRFTGRSREENGLYELESTYLQGTNQLSIYTRVSDESALNELKLLFDLLSKTGFGKKKGTGSGKFKILDYKERPDLLAHENQGNAVIWLNAGVPDQSDPTDGWYKLETKYGKLGGSFATEGFPFKRPLTRILAGAVFKTEQIKPFYGKMITGISSYYPTVMQYGYAVCLPVKI